MVKPGPGNRPTKCDTMKKLLKIVYTDRFVFGGFKDGKNRLFFVIPCFRISFCPYADAYSLTIGVGILFWEFVWTIEIEK